MSRDWISNEIFRRVDPEGRTMGEYMAGELKSDFGIEIICGMKEGEHAAFKKRLIPMKQLGAMNMIKQIRQGNEKGESGFLNIKEAQASVKEMQEEMKKHDEYFTG